MHLMLDECIDAVFAGHLQLRNEVFPVRLLDSSDYRLVEGIFAASTFRRIIDGGLPLVVEHELLLQVLCGPFELHSHLDDVFQSFLQALLLQFVSLDVAEPGLLDGLPLVAETVTSIFIHQTH
jgi:hypothetical protein